MPRLALHLIWGCYGFWLPNDPRGSWSIYVGSRDLYEIGGGATKVATTRSLASRSHDRELRIQTKRAMKDLPVRLDGAQARFAALGIADAAAEAGLSILALAVMPDHVHVVSDNRGEDARVSVGRLKSGATRRLNAEARSPRDGTPWVRGGWFVPLDDEPAIVRAIDYVDGNPTRAGLRRQRWSCVQPYPSPTHPKGR